MEPSILDGDDEGKELLAMAKEYIAKEEHIKALEIIEDLILVHGEDKGSWCLRYQQGQIFMQLAKRSENPDVQFAYVLAAVECFAEDDWLKPVCASSLRMLARQIDSRLYYKKSLEKAKQSLSVIHWDTSVTVDQLSLKHQRKLYERNQKLESMIKDTESKIAFPKTLQGSTTKNFEPEVWDSKKSPEPSEDAVVKGLRSYWLGLDVKIKRDFMKVSIAKLTSFVEGVHNGEGLDALESVLAFAREHRTWIFWMCRTICLRKFSSAEECKTHLEQQHAADFKPDSDKNVVKRIGNAWARKISGGVWEPLDAEMIKKQLADVKPFTSKSKKGWSKWPLAADEERRNLLEEIKLILVSLIDHQILSCSIRDWVMRFPIKHLGQLGVSKQSLIDSHLLETPQIICFLERPDLIQIRDFLKTIKCDRHDGTDLVCRAVDSVLDRTRIKEKIDFDSNFSYVLLDKRLLKRHNAPSDDDNGKINLIDDPDIHYAKARAQGDDIISWLVDYSSVDKSFLRPIREHNLDIWVAVLRAVQFTCRDLGTEYAKKKQVLDYEAALAVVENLCMSEDDRRRNVQKDQWNSYASLLCDRCEERVPENSLTTKLFLCAVRDVFDGAWDLTFDFPDLEDCLKLIREGKSTRDDIVLRSIDILKPVVTEKVLLIDSKILLIDDSRIRLLNNLTRLSVFDHRSYILQMLKPFLLNEIVIMESKAKSDAAEAQLLLAEERKSQAKKKKKTKSVKNEIVNLDSKAKSDAAEAHLLFKEEMQSQAKEKKKTKSIKITSTSMSSPLDKTVELEPESTSPSLKTMEDENSMEPEDTLASERKFRLEISSNTEIQQEGTKVDRDDMQNMPREDSQSEQLESELVGVAARYNAALDMTLKALMNINVFKKDLKHNKEPFLDDLEEQVPCALQNLFTAVVSGEIKTEGVYSIILGDLLASLEEVNSMLSNAAEVLVSILESWHCWKNSERESLVTRLFTLEEYERMSCRKCRRKPNYPEQSSYGIVMSADSIRDIKCAFRNIKFVDILKVIRVEYKMLCDVKTGGCGETNFVHHFISRCPSIFTIVLEWEKSGTEKEISETIKALEWEIDISRLYEGLEQNTNYRLVSMVGYGEGEEEQICIAYEKNRWVNLRRESLAGEVVGNWKSVVRFCGDKKVRPVILLYEAAGSMMP